MFKALKKPVVIQDYSEYDQCAAFTRMECLDNGNLFFISYNGLSPKTFIRIYKNLSLNNRLFEQIIDGHWSFLANLQTNHILIQNVRSRALIFVDYSLNRTLSQNENREDFHYVFPLPNQKFFAVTQTLTKKYQFEFYGYEHNEIQFLHHIDTPSLSIQTEYLDNTLNRRFSDIISLGDNRYACRIVRDNTRKVLVFEVNFDTTLNLFTLNDLTSFIPIAYYYHHMMRCLANGNLLIFGEHEDKAQVWDPQSGKCIKEWSWNRQLRSNLSRYVFHIFSFPTANYLLFNGSDNLYLFDVSTLKAEVIKHQKKAGFDLAFYQYISPQGDLFLISNKCFNNVPSTMQIQQLELFGPSYRKKEQLFFKSQLQCGFYFTREAGIPREISKIIIDMAFTKKTKAQFILDHDDSTVSNSCVIL